MAIAIRGVNNIVIVSVFGAIATIVVVLRIYSRRLKQRSLDVNDYAAISALVFSLAMGADGIVGVVAGGMGFHETELSNPSEQNTVIFKVLFAMQILWSFANTSAKISLCHLYTTIFRGKSFRIAVFTAIGLSIAYLLSVVLQTVLMCTPEALNWDETITYGHCGNKYAAYLAVGIGNLITDMVIIILPMPFLWKLQLPMPQKLALTGIFGIGIIICVVTTVRIIELVTADLTDASYALCNIAFWSLLEPLLSTICCCLPVLQPVVKKFVGRMATRHSRAIYSYGSSKPKIVPEQKNRGFHLMEEGNFPLTELERDVYANYNKDLEMKEQAAAPGITVQHEWTVSSV